MMQQPPWTMFQGPDDRFPRTRNLGAMQQGEKEIEALTAQKTDLDFMKDVASYESKKLGQKQNLYKRMLEEMKNGRA